MEKIALSGLTQLLAERLRKSDSSASNLPADFFQIWQLCWLMHAGGCGIDMNLQRNFQISLHSYGAKSVLPIIQSAWMKLHGFPALQKEKPLFTVKDFFLLVHRLFTIDSSADNEAKFVFTFLRETCGLSDEHKKTAFKLIDEALKLRPTRELKVAQKFFEVQWIDIADECVQLENTINESNTSVKVSLSLVTLPAALQTPMSWMMIPENSGKIFRIFIAWPEGLCRCSFAEQLALLAHELHHCKQLALDATQPGQLTVYQRELEALECEWAQLKVICSTLQSSEAKFILKQWREIHFTQQLQILRKDLELYRSSLRNGDMTEPSPSLRLPFSSLVYAICASRVTQNNSDDEER